MGFGNVDRDDCRSEERRGFGAGIAAVVVIILLLIAMGIVFEIKERWKLLMYGMNYGQMNQGMHSACCPQPVCHPYPVTPVVGTGVGVGVIAVAILILIALGLIF